MKQRDFDRELPLERMVTGYSRTAIFRTMAFVGDSLSSGEFETVDANGKYNYHDVFEYSWGQFLARKNGIVGYNFSRGGMTAKEFVTEYADRMGYFARSLAASAYVIALGVNDLYILHTEVGTIDDVDVQNYKNNKPTFLGYYGQIISRYREISPNAKFFLVTFPRDTSHEGDPINEEMRQGLYALAERFDNTYVIDLYQYGPLYDEEFHKRHFLHHHMSPAGYLMTAELIDSYIDYIVRTQYDDFKNVGLDAHGIPHL